ncbi:MAG: hypothetical protein ABIP88_10625 [Candidatus Binatia bacterium]
MSKTAVTGSFVLAASPMGRWLTNGPWRAESASSGMKPSLLSASTENR